MEAKKIFSKLNIKNYNNELEEILEEKLFSFEVKNLLLSMLYKIENAYKDYETIKVEVLPLKEIVHYLIKTIKEKCFEIQFIALDKEEQIDKEKGKISCYPNEKSLLSAIWCMGEQDSTIVIKYPYAKEPIQQMLLFGSNMSIVEILRDFNGWSWDVVTDEIDDLKYNILYQSLLLLDGKRLFTMNIDSDEKNSMLIQRDKKQFEEFFHILIASTIKLYKEENQEWRVKIDQIRQEKEKQLELVRDKKRFVQQITNEKKECIAQIERIDKIINNADLLREEYQQRNEILPNREKIFSISHLSDRLEKEREICLEQIQQYNKMIEPKEFVKEKVKLEQELEILQGDKEIVDCCRACLECCKKQIERLEDKSEIIRWIYKIRYYGQIPFDENVTLKDIKELQQMFKEVIQLIIKKAQEHKVWDIFTENEEIAYIVVKELFDSKMISLENVNMICDYKDNVLYVTYYDGNTIESKAEFELENVRIKKKIKLFI